MGNSIDISSLSSEIGSVLSMYSKDVTNETEKWLKETAKKTSKTVKKNASKAGFKVDPKYVNGWTYKKVNGHWVVYNKDKPGLAHLLEKGHSIVVHGKATGKKTRAFPHIKPAEEEIQNLVSDLERSLGNL